MVFREELPPMRKSPDGCHTVLWEHVEFLNQSHSQTLLSGWSWNEILHTQILMPISPFSLLHSSTYSRSDNHCKKSLQHLGEISLQFSQGRNHVITISCVSHLETLCSSLVLLCTGWTLCNMYSRRSPLPSLPFARMNFSALRQF